MQLRHFGILAAALAAPLAAFAADDFQLPPGVTPKMRAACEGDVRRLCLGANPTVEKVKACVAAKFLQLGRRCQYELASAGFNP